MINQQQINKLLAFFAQKIIAKYKPLVIGITGSVGKTSTRHAIAAALSAKYKLREPIKNYNNEIGIPLTVIGSKGVDEEIGFVARKVAWLKVFLKGLAVWLLPQDYSKVLVLEYGIDHPGDMDVLLDIVEPKIAVITTVGISHKEFFATEADIAHEKGKIVTRLPENGFFVYNADDHHVSEQTGRTKAQLVSFGKQSNSNADVVLQSIEEQLQLPPASRLSFKTPSRELAVTVPALGTAHNSAILAAVAVAEALEVESDLIIRGLASYRAMPGRLNVIAGIKKTILIDDTYNAAPASTAEALNLLGRFPNLNKIAVLGDMRELGDESDLAHAQIGHQAASIGLARLLTVGELGQKIAQAAVEAGMPAEKILTFPESSEAAKSLLDMIEPESVVLIKGSQAVRMEKITKELLMEPTAAGQLLVRQYGKWLSN